MDYRDTDTLYAVNDVVGEVKNAKIDQDKLELTGQVEPLSMGKYGLDHILLVEQKKRFISSGLLEKDGTWSIAIDTGNIGNDNGFLELKVFAASQSMNFMFPLDVSRQVEKKYKKFVSSCLPKDSQDVPSFIDEYKKIIINAMNKPYVARSNHEAIKTGNSYQTIDFGDVEKRGGRTNRINYLYQIDFQGKTVLDLGANTGENSRIVRKLGASLVDGIEYDPLFVEIGRAINAVSGMTRVSLFQGDCTNPGEFEGMHYDIVLALAVWVYLGKTIKDVAAITDLLVFETHTLDHGMESYYEPVLKYFPYAVSLGYSDKPIDPHKSRMFVIFGKKQEDIEKLIHRNFLKVQPYFKNLFIEKYNHLSKQEILKMAKEFYARHEGNADYPDEDYQFGRIVYFEVFLAGFHQYLQNNKKVNPDNIFLNFLQNGIQAGVVDPGLKKIAENPTWLLRKIANKYDDAFNIVNGKSDLVAPIELSRDDAGKFTFETITGEEIRCNNIDGHHRFFLYELAGLDKVHYKIIEKDPALDQLLKYKKVLKSNYTLDLSKQSKK